MVTLRSTPDGSLRVLAQFGDIVLCFWAIHLTLTVPLSTPRCTNGYRGEFNAGAVALQWTSMGGGGGGNIPSRFGLIGHVACIQTQPFTFTMCVTHLGTNVS